MKRLVTSIALLALPATAGADPLFDDVVEKGSAEGLVAPVKWRGASDPQALSSVLVRTKLLETMHHFDAAPKGRDGALDVGAMERLGVLDANGRHYTFVLQGTALTAAMVRIPVPVVAATGDQRGWSRDRLARRKRALGELARYRLKPSKKDAYGNVFEWNGRAPGGRVFVWYRPDVDELVALFVRR